MLLLASILTLALAVPPVGAPDVGAWNAPHFNQEARGVPWMAETTLGVIPPVEGPDLASDAGRAAYIHQEATRAGVSGPWLEATLRCESGFRSDAVGAAGELGPAQLHPRGLLPEFHRRGYGSPFDFAAAVQFTAQMFAEGQARHWTCSRRAR